MKGIHQLLIGLPSLSWPVDIWIDRLVGKVELRANIGYQAFKFEKVLDFLMK
jgi:hypothetical protein